MFQRKGLRYCLPIQSFLRGVQDPEVHPFLVLLLFLSASVAQLTGCLSGVLLFMCGERFIGVTKWCTGISHRGLTATA